MCGRASLSLQPDELEEFLRRYGLEASVPWYTPRYNIAPSQNHVVIVEQQCARSVRVMRWGLVPSWAKDIKIGNKAINARAETVDSKPMFRGAFKSRRALVSANGYFEWKGETPNKQPYFIHAPDHSLLIFAGLWEHWWPVKDAKPVLTFTIVTGPPGIVSGDIHDRAPLILPPESWDAWLQGTVEDAKRIVETTKEPELAYYPVSKAVGAPKNDAPANVEPIAAG